MSCSRLILALLFLASVTACGTRQPIAGASLPSPAASGAACPSAGSSLPTGTNDQVDYADLFRYGSRTYLGVLANSASVSVSQSQLGTVITHVRCSLSAVTDSQHNPPSGITDGTATALPAGTPIYEVRGYPPQCRLAAYLDRRLHIYLAQRDTATGRTTLTCAMTPSGRS